MNCNWKENKREKTLFKSYYCLDCKQIKVCGKLDTEICCSCYYQSEQEKAKEYSSYEKVLESKKREQKARFRQSTIFKELSGL